MSQSAHICSPQHYHGSTSTAWQWHDMNMNVACQVPQFLLDAAIEHGQGAVCNIVCTQPRRIAAISVAERVASERGEPAPGQAGSSVG